MSSIGDIIIVFDQRLQLLKLIIHSAGIGGYRNKLIYIQTCAPNSFWLFSTLYLIINTHICHPIIQGKLYALKLGGYFCLKVVIINYSVRYNSTCHNPICICVYPQLP